MRVSYSNELVAAIIDDGVAIMLPVCSQPFLQQFQYEKPIWKRLWYLTLYDDPKWDIRRIARGEIWIQFETINA